MVLNWFWAWARVAPTTLGTVTVGPLLNWDTASAPIAPSPKMARMMIQIRLRRDDFWAARGGGYPVGWYPG